MSDLTVAQRIHGGLMGLLVGDSLGVPFEFHHLSSLPPLDQIEMTPPFGFNRAHLGTPVGTWSDDGAQALCLAKSLLVCDHLDLDDFGKRLLDWLDQGYMAIDGRVFDCGAGTRASLCRLRKGTPAALSGSESEYNNGNGALMRVLPLVLWHKGELSELIELAHKQCMPTHRHAVAQVCCALYCVVARLMLQGESGDDATWDLAAGILEDHYKGNVDFLNAMAHIWRFQHRSKPTGSGYIVDQIWTCRWALAQGGYEEVVKNAISLGNDTDTSACIAGGLAGIRDGVMAIPERWREALRGDEIRSIVIQELMARELNQPLPTIDLSKKDEEEIPESGLTQSTGFVEMVRGIIQGIFGKN